MTDDKREFDPAAGQRRDSNENGQKYRNDVAENGQPSYYYSYGPFKSNSLPNHISRPRSEDSISVRPVGAWEYRRPAKRLTFKSLLASFLAGALVVGSLMVVSDKMNLFSDQAFTANEQTQESGTSSGGGNGGVVNASLNIIRPNTIADIVQKSSPAVVKIETYVQSSKTGGSPFSGNDIYRYWFGDQFDQFFKTPQNEGNGEQRVMVGMGSGFIFDKDGYILTNEHVVHGAEEIYVSLEQDKDPYKAKLLGSDFDLDLAVLKIEKNNDFPVLKLGDSTKVRVGDWLTAIGNPKGFDHTVSVGVLSAKNRDIQINDNPRPRTYSQLLQTDASINPGNSGGPLLNLNGEVVGINTAVSADAQGIGFAIPTNVVAGVVEQLKANKKIPKPWIGVSLMDIEKSWVKDLKLDNEKGALVRGIYQNSPAEKAGLQVNDVITEVNGKAIEKADDLVKIVQSSKVGQKLEITVVREGRKLTTTISLEDQNQ